MMIISFAWTTKALLAGRKSRTRREWTANYAKRFKVGDLVQVYDKQPRFGGKRVAIIRITGKKYEPVSMMPDSDYEKEGFKFMAENGLKIWDKHPKKAFREWREENGCHYIIDFELVKIFRRRSPTRRWKLR